MSSRKARWVSGALVLFGGVGCYPVGPSMGVSAQYTDVSLSSHLDGSLRGTARIDVSMMAWDDEDVVVGAVHSRLCSSPSVDRSGWPVSIRSGESLHRTIECTFDLTALACGDGAFLGGDVVLFASDGDQDIDLDSPTGVGNPAPPLLWEQTVNIQPGAVAPTLDGEAWVVDGNRLERVGASGITPIGSQGVGGGPALAVDTMTGNMALLEWSPDGRVTLFDSAGQQLVQMNVAGNLSSASLAMENGRIAILASHGSGKAALTFIDSASRTTSTSGEIDALDTVQILATGSGFVYATSSGVTVLDEAGAERATIPASGILGLAAANDGRLEIVDTLNGSVELVQLSNGTEVARTPLWPGVDCAPVSVVASTNGDTLVSEDVHDPPTWEGSPHSIDYRREIRVDGAGNILQRDFGTGARSLVQSGSIVLALRDRTVGRLE